MKFSGILRDKKAEEQAVFMQVRLVSGTVILDISAHLQRVREALSRGGKQISLEGVSRTFRGKIARGGRSTLPASVAQILRAQQMLFSTETKQELIRAELQAMHKRYEENNFSICVQAQENVQDRGLDIIDTPGGLQDIITAIEIACLVNDVSFEKGVGIFGALKVLSEKGIITKTEEQTFFRNYFDLCGAYKQYYEVLSARDIKFEEIVKIVRNTCIARENVQDLSLRIINRNLVKADNDVRPVWGGIIVESHPGLYFDRYTGLRSGVIELVDWNAEDPPSPAVVLDIIVGAAKNGWQISENLRSKIKSVDENGFSPALLYWKVFKPIKSAGQNEFYWVGQAVHILHDLRILDKCIPEFARARYLQQDDSHRHTVDYHMVQVLDEVLKLLEKGEILFGEIPKEHVPVLLLTALFHDIAKDCEHADPPQKHEIVGAPVVGRILESMYIPREEVGMAEKLVLMHTKFSVYYWNPPRDPNDWGEIIRFARDEVGETGFLRLLYVLIRADYSSLPDSSISRMLSVPKRLLQFTERFVVDAYHYLESDESIRAARSTKKVWKEVLPEVKRHLGESKWLHLLASLHLRLFSTRVRYILEKPEVIAEDIVLIDQMKRARAEAPYKIKVIDHPTREYDIIKVVAEEQPDFLWKLAGILSMHGVNVSRLNVYSRRWNLWHLLPWSKKRRVSIYKFFVGGLSREKERLIRAEFKEVFRLDAERAEQRISRQKPSFPAPPVSPEINFDLGGSARFTILDVISPDRLFLLFDIGRVIAEHGKLYIALAHSDRDMAGRDIVINSFYLLGPDGEKITDPGTLEHIKDRLLGIMGAGV